MDFGWLFIFSGFGFLLYAGFPWLLANLYPMRWQLKVGHFYYWLAMFSYQVSKLVRRNLGKVEMVPTSWDSDKDAEKVELDEVKHVRDPDNRMKRLKNKPFGLMFESIPLVCDAELAELGKQLREHSEDGKLLQEDEPGRPKVNPFFEVSPEMQVVDPAFVEDLVTNDADPEDGKTSEKFTGKAMEGYRRKIGAAETVSIIMGFLAGFGALAFWFEYIMGNGSGMPEGGISQPLGYIHIPTDVIVALL